MTPSQQFDCFISHASEDKDDFVSPLALELRRLGVRVWFDKFELKVGDSLSRKIDEGLLMSKFGVVVLSKAFFSKAWPDYELRGLVAREIGSEKVILPVWYGVGRKDVLSFSPPLADKLAVSAACDDVRQIVRQLLEVIRPDILEQIHRIEALNHHRRTQPIREIPIAEIKIDETIRHPVLTPQQMVRIRNVHYILHEVYPVDIAEAVLSFKRDIYVNSEIWVWEGIAATFGTYKTLFKPSNEELREAFSALLQMSMGMFEAVYADNSFNSLTRSKIDTLLEVWSKVPSETILVRDQL